MSDENSAGCILLSERMRLFGWGYGKSTVKRLDNGSNYENQPFIPSLLKKNPGGLAGNISWGHAVRPEGQRRHHIVSQPPQSYVASSFRPTYTGILCCNHSFTISS
ncbi:hypothetical protein NQZ79_g1277 [Umbelopsis isabellina]|nr:hypothetical protein NQZ79_g1277 [Umbelopsis isabellina]